MIEILMQFMMEIVTFGTQIPGSTIEGDGASVAASLEPGPLVRDMPVPSVLGASAVSTLDSQVSTAAWFVSGCAAQEK